MAFNTIGGIQIKAGDTLTASMMNSSVVTLRLTRGVVQYQYPLLQNGSIEEIDGKTQQLRTTVRGARVTITDTANPAIGDYPTESAVWEIGALNDITHSSTKSYKFDDDATIMYGIA